MDKAIDTYWRSIIDFSRVPRTEDLYIVGSFAKSVTVYSQQVRAISLIDAMCGLGRLRHSSRVAVIGGGIAGLTAAAALIKIGVSVTLFEKEGYLIPLQRNSGKRYIHPHIYDWPFTSIDATDAHLPILTWEAKHASKLVEDLENQWKAIVGANNTCVRLDTEVQHLKRTGQQWLLKSKMDDLYFDAVISTVGFGVESGTGFSYPYWADLPLDDPRVHSQNWLVSGAGDGALTDLMRLCIRNFAHEDTLRRVIKIVEDKAGAQFMDKIRERIHLKKDHTGPELFAGLDITPIAEGLDLRENQVTLNASEVEVFGTPVKPARSSVLNRLVTWILIGASKVKCVEGRIPDDGIEGQRPHYRVRIGNCEAPIPFDDVLLRHGPEAPFRGRKGSRLPDWMDRTLERQVDQLARSWDRLYRLDEADPTTRRDHWSDNMFAVNRLSPDFTKHSSLLVYSQQAVGRESTAFRNAMTEALTSDKVRSALSDTVSLYYPKDTLLISLLLEDALAEPRTFGRTIRALCDAPIAIFDGTVEHPYLMFLLGIRSVVRRGITVVIRIGDLNAAAWQEMAFNLRELNLVTASNRSGVEFEAEVRDAVVEGLKLYARHPFHYSDLPAFIPVRNLGGGEDDFLPRTGTEQVLVLCPFDPVYTRDCWPQLQRALRNHWTPDRDKGPARRVIDLRSPELVERRLFEAIRRNNECVADLTLNRANIFFELGARMVANAKGARIVRCSDRLEQGDIARLPAHDCSQLDELMGVASYSVEPETNMGISEALCLQSDWPGGTVTPHYAFTIAQDSVDLRQEGGGRSVETLLWNAMEETLGQNRSQKIYPVLYANENPAIQSQTRQFAFNAMLAYVVFTNTLPAERRDENKRKIALNQLESMLSDLNIDANERSRLQEMIQSLQEHHRDN